MMIMGRVVDGGEWKEVEIRLGPTFNRMKRGSVGWFALLTPPEVGRLLVNWTLYTLHCIELHHSQSTHSNQLFED
jgi:hypothetical protein